MWRLLLFAFDALGQIPRSAKAIGFMSPSLKSRALTQMEGFAPWPINDEQSLKCLR